MPKRKGSNKNYTHPFALWLKKNTCVASSGDSWTHTSIGSPAASYYIKQSDMDDFFKMYYQAVFVDKIPIHLTERITDCNYTPLKIDLDFKYFSKDCKRIYKKEDIFKICQIYMEELEKFLAPLDDEERDFFILEKTQSVFDLNKNGDKKKNWIERTDDNNKIVFYNEQLDEEKNTKPKSEDILYKIKDGVHIMAPNIVLNEYLQLIIRENVYKRVGEFLDKYNFFNSYADIFDKAVIDRNNWQMYGSSKPNKEAYLVTSIIRVWKDKYEESINIPYKDDEIVELLSVRNKMDPSLIKYEVEANDPKLSLSSIESKKTKKKRFISGKKKKNSVRKQNKKQLELTYRYIDCLNRKRAGNFHQWMEVGWCLHNLHNKDNKLLLKWIEFSKKEPSYAATADEECVKKWNEMCGEGLGMGSLKLWAKKDCPEKYTKIVQDDISMYILKACNIRSKKVGTSFDVAYVMNKMYSDYFVCVSNKNDMWFYYNKQKNRWIEDDKGMQLKKKISTEVYREFNKLRTEYTRQSLESDDENARRADKISSVILRLKETPFKGNLMTECRELFYDDEREFLEKLDSNNNLIGCANGVYDLKTETFRKGRPEDLISKSTKIDYKPYDPQDADVRDIIEFLKGIFVVKSVRQYVLKRASSFLSGSTRDETFDIFSGGGGNGKSKLMELLEECLGEYCVKLPITLLTNKRGASNAATPELARTKGARLASLQEPDTNTKLNVGLMKELTGGDKIQARALFQEPFEFKPQFKIVLCCNDKPELPPHDEGTWRRVRNTEFISKFVHEPEEDKILHFKRNEDLSEKFENWAETFLSILIHYHSIYKREGLKVPDEILEYTEEYRSTNEQIKDFVNDRIEIDPASKIEINFSSIMRAYKEWYKENHPNTKDMKKSKEVQSYFDEKFKTVKARRRNDKKYTGIKIIEPDDGMTMQISDELD